MNSYPIRIKTLLKLASTARQQVQNTKLYPEDLAGACGVASLFLMNLANERGIRPTFVGGYFNKEGHCWIEYDQWIIDPTATQFLASAEEIHIVKKNNPNYLPDLKTKKFYLAYDDVNRWDQQYPIVKSQAKKTCQTINILKIEQA